ncbi:MAG TPA: methylmalonyl-CoA mutase family protein, partial [Dehalococcoidia bacterium]|nr:methylmalonyl-CoA mutase family protein [Dehalococcoidia bacterium]
AVDASLKAIGQAARTEDENLIPYFVDAVKTYATVGEMCDVLRDVFGVYRPESL